MPDHAVTRRQFLRYTSALAAVAISAQFMGGASKVARADEPMELESRIIFDEGLNWVTRASADRLCSRIARAGFNVFSPCVWHGR